MGPSVGKRVRRIFAAAAIIVGSVSGAVLASATGAGATTTTMLYVNARTGTMASGCTGPGATACRTIQQGVAAAEALTGQTVTVTVAAGDYAGGITIATTYRLAIRGAGAALTTVTGRGKLRDLTISGGTVVISGLTIKHGHSTAGGGVSVTKGVTQLTQDRISDDSAGGVGGAVLNRATATLTDDAFSDDAAGDGGAVKSSGQVTLSHDTFSHDTAQTGGAVEIASGEATLFDDTFSHDAASLTGAITIAGGGVTVGAFGRATLTGDTFVDDTATGGWGGAVSNSGSATVRDDTFVDDSAKYGGGVTNTGIATLTDDTFTYDAATEGGAFYNLGTHDQAGGRSTLVDDTFLHDSATKGGGIFGAGMTATSVTASILSKSTCRGDVTGEYDVTTTTSPSCALAQSRRGVAPAAALDLTPALKANTSTGPETLSIGPTSPALDEVPKAACTVATDERSDPRPGLEGQTSCDAGAYELQHTPGTLIQGPPTSGSATHGTAASYQLAVTKPRATTGEVSFAATGALPSGVTLSEDGRITVSATTAVGTYTFTGTDYDPLHDSGSWTFSLDVSG